MKPSGTSRQNASCGLNIADELTASVFLGRGTRSLITNGARSGQRDGRVGHNEEAANKDIGGTSGLKIFLFKPVSVAILFRYELT